MRPSGDSSDAGLLARFVAARDEAAFGELVLRHGPMVLGVCRRILRNPHDVEDAFQATFLVLTRKAAKLDRQRPLGSWLYTVARNLALDHRASAARRRAQEEAAAVATIELRDEPAWREVGDVLDAELGRLPEKYRAPLVLCHLQGMTHEAAARELGCPAGSMAKRLSRGQELLRARLAGRGVTLSALGFATLAPQLHRFPLSQASPGARTQLFSVGISCQRG
jgi:RNA polymerase sigma factor (sigma-70 family)